MPDGGCRDGILTVHLVGLAVKSVDGRGGYSLFEEYKIQATRNMTKEEWKPEIYVGAKAVAHVSLSHGSCLVPLMEQT